MKHAMKTGRARCAPAGASLHRARNMRGISLIEVMVSVVIIAIGLLGIAAMQSVALRGSQGSLESSQAVMQTNAIMEAMRANRANAGNYNGSWAAGALPTGTTLAARDLNTWLAGMRGVANWNGVTVTPAVIGASTTATIAGCPNACVITISWDDTRAGGAVNRAVRTETRI